ncbi:hypothetical protein A5881_001556 [Enterococcus termitis]
MVQYKIRYFDIPVPKPHKRAYLKFMDVRYDGLTFLINDNITTDLNWEYSIVNQLKKVLSGELEPQGTGTNRTTVEITKETTTIIDHFWGDETMDYFEDVVVPTKDLYDLIIWWIQKKIDLEIEADQSGLTEDELNARSTIIDTEKLAQNDDEE